jgi:hypothetical protein
MKTAIQQLKKEIQDASDKTVSSERKWVYDLIITYINHTYLEIEKQQIIKTFELGNDLGHKGRLPSGEGYYNETFTDKF